MEGLNTILFSSQSTLFFATNTPIILVSMNTHTYLWFLYVSLLDNPRLAIFLSWKHIKCISLPYYKNTLLRCKNLNEKKTSNECLKKIIIMIIDAININFILYCCKQTLCQIYVNFDFWSREFRALEFRNQKRNSLNKRKYFLGVTQPWSFFMMRVLRSHCALMRANR